MSSTSRAVWFSSTRFFSRERARKFVPELGLVLKKKWKNINAVFFEIVLTSLTRKTSQGKRRPGLPRDRMCRKNGERLEPELSQTSQIASMRRCHPPFFFYSTTPFFFIPLPPNCRKFSLGSATSTKQVGLYLGCVKSQNLARLGESAKINTRKIIGTPKSQNFVLANNSNIKVPCFCQISPGMHLWGALVPIRTVFMRSNPPRG